jgi:hypothetical protein
LVPIDADGKGRRFLPAAVCNKMAAKSRGRGGGSAEEVLALLEAAQNLLEKDRDPPKGRLTMQLEIR